MDFPSISTADAQKLMFVLARVSAILFFSPVLDNPILLARFKMGLALVLTLMLFPIVQMEFVIQSPVVMGLYIIKEIVVGMAIGLAINLVFGAVQLAGQVTGFQMGLGIVSIIDPFTSTRSSVVTQLYNILTILFFFTFDAHHIVVRALADSFRWIPLGGVQFSEPLFRVLVRASGSMFLLAVKIGLPVIAVSFFVSVGLALLARTVPQMNVFIVAFPLKIAVGLAAVGLSVPFFGTLLQKSFSGAEVHVHALLRAM